VSECCNGEIIENEQGTTDNGWCICIYVF